MDPPDGEIMITDQNPGADKDPNQTGFEFNASPMIDANP